MIKAVIKEPSPKPKAPNLKEITWGLEFETWSFKGLKNLRRKRVGFAIGTFAFAVYPVNNDVVLLPYG